MGALRRSHACALVILAAKSLKDGGVPLLHPNLAVFPMLAGFIWNCGNVTSLYGIDYLGLGVGFSLTQTALIVAGIWAVTLYQEIRGTKPIAIFFLSASVLVSGAVMLGKFGNAA